MLAAVTELSAVRASRPSPDPLFRPAGESTGGWPLLATPVPAGFPAPADDTVERSLSLDDHLIRHPESTFFVRVQGDARAVEGLHDGDLLVVDRAGPATTGSIVVVVVNGAFALGRLVRDAEGRRVVQSAHPAHPDRPPGGGQDPILWGVVRWAVHRVWPARER